MKRLILLVCLSGLLATGCANYRFTPYVGAQQAWKTAPGCFVSTNGVLPIYYGLPTKPYSVLGMMTVLNPLSVGMSTRLARYNGGDAMVLCSSETFDRGTMQIGGGSSTYSTGNYSARSTGNYAYGNYSGSSQTYNSPSYNVPISETIQTFAVIKFKTPAQIRLDTINILLAEKDSHPNGFSITNKDGSVSSFTAAEVQNAMTNLEREKELLSGTNSISKDK